MPKTNLAEAARLVQQRIVKRLLGRAFVQVRPHIRSKTLRAALRQQTVGINRGYLEVPHYWTIYYHRGVTGPVRPRYEKFLCWFPNPKDDPRYAGGYPVRFNDVKSLRQVWSTEQFKAALRRNTWRRRRGLPPYMVLRKVKGGHEGHPFYDIGLPPQKMIPEAHRIAIEEMDVFFKSALAGYRRQSVERIRIVL